MSAFGHQSDEEVLYVIRYTIQKMIELSRLWNGNGTETYFLHCLTKSSFAFPSWPTKNTTEDNFRKSINFKLASFATFTQVNNLIIPFHSLDSRAAELTR